MCDNNAKLAAMIADLDGYIERRATEIAAERVRASHERAEQLLAEAQVALGDLRAAMQRDADLITELRRRLDARDRQLEQLRRTLAERRASDDSPLP